MSTLSELIHYCNEEDPIGALLLTGEWGCGKSYLIENDLTKALEKNAHHCQGLSVRHCGCRNAAQHRPAELV